MRTRYLFFLLLICVQTFVISGQDSISLTKPKIIIGTKVIWENSGDRHLTIDTRWVYSGGLQILKPSCYKFIQFETGLYLWSKVLAMDYDDIFFEIHRHLIFQYLSVPLNCRLTTKYFFLSAGPNFDYLISLNRNHWPSNYMPKSNMNSFAIGANANAGLQFTFHRMTTFIEARYAWTLSSIEKDEGFVAQWRFLNIGVGIGLNYSFGPQPRI